VAQSIGLVIGCAVDAQAAVYLGPISTIPTLLFSGNCGRRKTYPNLINLIKTIAKDTKLQYNTNYFFALNYKGFPILSTSVNKYFESIG